MPWSGGRHLHHAVFPAVEFKHLVEDVGRAYEVYSGHPLSEMSPHKRGLFLQRLCRDVLTDAYPHLPLEEPAPGVCVNGRTRSAQQAPWDWTLGGRKAECKSSRLCWIAHIRTWRVSFASVKLRFPGIREYALFDDLYIVVDKPDSIEILKHDLCTGVSLGGKATAVRGHTISVSGNPGASCWQSAWADISRKLCVGKGRCEVIANIPLWDHRLQMPNCQTNMAYQAVPLSQMTPSLRAQRVEQMGYEIDQKLNPGGVFQRQGGRKLADWLRDDVRVELKHGRLVKDARGWWRCSFSNIKCADRELRDATAFDELWLPVYSPIRLDFFQRMGNLQCNSVGIRGILGSDFEVRSRSHSRQDVETAVCDIQQQLEKAGCCLVASVPW